MAATDQCPGCAAVVRASSRFCPACGVALAGPPSVAKPPAGAQDPAPPPVPGPPPRRRAWPFVVGGLALVAVAGLAWLVAGDDQSGGRSAGAPTSGDDEEAEGPADPEAPSPPVPLSEDPHLADISGPGEADAYLTEAALEGQTHLVTVERVSGDLVPVVTAVTEDGETVEFWVRGDDGSFESTDFVDQAEAADGVLVLDIFHSGVALHVEVRGAEGTAGSYRISGYTVGVD